MVEFVHTAHTTSKNERRKKKNTHSHLPRQPNRPFRIYKYIPYHIYMYSNESSGRNCTIHSVYMLCIQSSYSTVKRIVEFKSIALNGIALCHCIEYIILPTHTRFLFCFHFFFFFSPLRTSMDGHPQSITLTACTDTYIVHAYTIRLK